MFKFTHIKQKNNLERTNNNWFIFYKGYVYSNRVTSILDKINNKTAIDKIIQGANPLYTFM